MEKWKIGDKDYAGRVWSNKNGGKQETYKNKNTGDVKGMHFANVNKFIRKSPSTAFLILFKVLGRCEES